MAMRRIGIVLFAWAFTASASALVEDVPFVTPNGLNFLGVGYNILSGNPDGGDVTSGGVDPGLLVTRRVLELTYNNRAMSSNGRYHVPDQVTFVPRGSCVEGASKQVFYGTKSYQDVMTADVKLDSVLASIFTGYEFSQSSQYQEVKDATENSRHVFFEDRLVCNLGKARYLEELARVDRHPLSRSFVIDACALPESYTDGQNDYIDFLDNWGSAVVVEVDVGVKTVDRYRATVAKFVQYLRENNEKSLKPGGKFQDYADSMIVDMKAFTAEMTSTTRFGDLINTVTVGGDSFTEPIAVRIKSMHEFFSQDYWQLFDDYVADGLCEASFLTRLSATRANIRRALENLPASKHAQLSSDPSVQVPVTWPYGTYSLPMPQVGCPTSHFYWQTGSRYQDTENYLPNNYWSDPCHLQGPYYRVSVEQNFCSKTNAAEDEYNWAWPAGEYCVFKKGNECPDGFQEGWVQWDDSDVLNSNQLTGQVPEGVYDRDTLIYFCCREDGFASNPITLPTDDRFFLFKKSQQCQEVSGMRVSEEWFRWDGEDDRIVFRDYLGGSTPYNTGEDSDHLIHYCYYYTGIMD
ncbi:uncharacterized protein [Diadema setosum]|uniref:uncharacterized protein n=1 Tax=Diadema setosum TaxID=31175 RepID=UPI003B3A4FA6